MNHAIAYVGNNTSEAIVLCLLFGSAVIRILMAFPGKLVKLRESPISALAMAVLLGTFIYPALLLVSLVFTKGNFRPGTIAIDVVLALGFTWPQYVIIVPAILIVRAPELSQLRREIIAYSSVVVSVILEAVSLDALDGR